MSARKAWWIYSSIRIGLFIAVFAILYFALNIWGWLAAIFAAIISAAISVLTLDRFRSQAAAGLHEWKNRERTEDDIVEDEIIEADPTVLEQPPKRND